MVPGPGVELVAQPQHEEDGQGDVGRDEVGHVPVLGNEDGVAVGDGDNADDREREPHGVRLAPGLEGQPVVQAVEKDGLAEPEVRNAPADPAQEPGDGADVRKPVEHVRGGRRNVQVRQARAQK